MSFRTKFKQNKILQRLSSLQITVYCLLLLFVLTLWGTIAQAQSGLYLAQERYFNSIFFLAFGFLPFPGGQGVMWVLFFNLTSVALTRFIYQWKHIGILVIHSGLLLFLVSGFITLIGSEESYVSLLEEEATNVSSAYHTWELSVYEDKKEDPLKFNQKISAVDIKNFKPEVSLDFGEFGFIATVKEYLRNSTAYASADAKQKVRNASGISKIEFDELELSPEKNSPGVILTVTNDLGEKFDVLLYGREKIPTTITTSKGAYYVTLRLKRFSLPFLLKLDDFIMEKHPGTDTARSFKSLVTIENNDITREKLISMNNPLRYKGYTLYQSSYSIDNFGRESSTLSVVKNKGRIMPYISTFVTVLGLMIHFLVMAFKVKKKVKVAR